MSNLLSNVTFKSFIEIYKAYGLNQDSKDIKIKDHTLNLKIFRLEQHISKVTIVKEETQNPPLQKNWWHVWDKFRGFIHYNVQYVVFIVTYIILKWKFDIR